MDNRKASILNILIIVYNFIVTLANSSKHFVSYISIILLVFNLFVTIMALKNNGKQKSEIICLIVEILTGVVIVMTLI